MIFLALGPARTAGAPAGTTSIAHQSASHILSQCHLSQQGAMASPSCQSGPQQLHMHECQTSSVQRTPPSHALFPTQQQIMYRRQVHPSNRHKRQHILVDPTRTAYSSCFCLACTDACCAKLSLTPTATRMPCLRPGPAPVRYQDRGSPETPPQPRCGKPP